MKHWCLCIDIILLENVQFERLCSCGYNSKFKICLHLRNSAQLQSFKQENISLILHFTKLFWWVSVTSVVNQGFAEIGLFGDGCRPLNFSIYLLYMKRCRNVQELRRLADLSSISEGSLSYTYVPVKETLLGFDVTLKKK